MKTKVDAFLEQQLSEPLVGDAVKTLKFHLNTELTRIGRVLIEMSLESSKGNSSGHADIFSTKEHLNKAFRELFANHGFQDNTLNLATWLDWFNALYDQMHDDGADIDVVVVVQIGEQTRSMKMYTGENPEQSPKVWVLN